MDLVDLVRGLSLKVDSLVNGTTLTNPERFQLREEILAVAKGIAHAVDGPEQALKNIARGYTICTALKVCVDLNLPQWLPQTESRSLEELADSTGCDRRILRSTLQLLAHNGIFQQTSDGRWQHTELSAIMTESSFRAYLIQILDVKYRATEHLPRFLKETKYCQPGPGKTAFNAVYATPLDFYTYSNEFDHGAALNFAHSMENLARTQLHFLETSYPLNRFHSNSHFVDVAGGLGHLSYFLAQKLPLATFVVQDLPFIIEQAQKACSTAFRDRVSFQPQDMFSPQPKRELADNTKSVFLLKIILHDHGDQECKIILHNLKSVMNLGDRILILDTVIPETGGSLSSGFSGFLALSTFGTNHRTLKEFSALIHDCGEDLAIKTFSEGAGESDGMMVIEVTKIY